MSSLRFKWQEKRITTEVNNMKVEYDLSKMEVAPQPVGFQTVWPGRHVELGGNLETMGLDTCRNFHFQIQN